MAEDAAKPDAAKPDSAKPDSAKPDADAKPPPLSGMVSETQAAMGDLFKNVINALSDDIVERLKSDGAKSESLKRLPNVQNSVTDLTGTMIKLLAKNLGSAPMQSGPAAASPPASAPAPAPAPEPARPGPQDKKSGS